MEIGKGKYNRRLKPDCLSRCRSGAKNITALDEQYFYSESYPSML